MTPDSDDLLLSDPFGQGVARIVRRDGLVNLTTSDQKVYQARDVEDLTEQVLGWRLPLAGLPDWVRGRAAAGAPAQTQRDSSQRLAELRQSGWLVAVPRLQRSDAAGAAEVCRATMRKSAWR